MKFIKFNWTVLIPKGIGEVDLYQATTEHQYASLDSNASGVSYFIQFETQDELCILKKKFD